MSADHLTLLERLEPHLHPEVLDWVSAFLEMPTIRNSGELEEWGEEELRNLAGFANFSPLGLVLLRFLLEKIVFPQLEERIPGLEYACWKGWIIKPTPLLSTLRPLEGVSPQSTGDESEDYESYTYVLDERDPLRGEIVPGGVGVDFEGTMIALNMKGEVVIHDSKTGATLSGTNRMEISFPRA